MNLQQYYNHLHSDRLVYRQLSSNDIESWMDFYVNNANLQYLGINLNRTNYEMSKAWIEAQIERYNKNEFGQLAIISKNTGELIGTRGLSFIEIEGIRYIQSLGSIKPTYWRQGFGSESANCIYHYIFSHNISNQIISICHENNTASQGYLKKLGFEQQKSIKMNDRNVFIYQLWRTQWKSKNLSPMPSSKLNLLF